MAKTFDLLIKGGTVVNHNGTNPADIAVVDGRIADIGSFNDAHAAEIIDAAGLHVLPGVIDSQVHFREPGAEHKEDLETGSRAAVMGGVTCVFEMPNTSPTTTTPEALADKVARATHRMHCDFAFYVGGTHENAEQIPILESLPGSAGIKVFMGSSTGDLLLDDEDALQRLFAKLSRRAAFHSEDEGRLRDRRDEQRHNDPLSHPIWRDEQAALQCTKRLVRLARHVQRRVHVLHISTAEELSFLSDHKDLASIEATPHHLTLSWPEDYERLGTKVQMNPPVRGPEHRDALWRAIATGLIDVLGSDHAPHTLEEKNQPYPRSPSGMPGVQTLVPVMLDHVNAGRLSLQRFVDLTSHGPNRLFGLARKGRIARGYDADLTIVDLGLKREITDNWIASRCGWTPYHGKRVTGWPVGTIIRGQRVMWDGEIAAPAHGEPAEFAGLGPKQFSNT